MGSSAPSTLNSSASLQSPSWWVFQSNTRTITPHLLRSFFLSLRFFSSTLLLPSCHPFFPILSIGIYFLHSALTSFSSQALPLCIDIHVCVCVKERNKRILRQSNVWSGLIFFFNLVKLVGKLNLLPEINYYGLGHFYRRILCELNNRSRDLKSWNYQQYHQNIATAPNFLNSLWAFPIHSYSTWLHSRMICR